MLKSIFYKLRLLTPGVISSKIENDYLVIRYSSGEVKYKPDEIDPDEDPYVLHIASNFGIFDKKQIQNLCYLLRSLYHAEYSQYLLDKLLDLNLQR